MAIVLSLFLSCNVLRLIVGTAGFHTSNNDQSIWVRTILFSLAIVGYYPAAYYIGVTGESELRISKLAYVLIFPALGMISGPLIIGSLAIEGPYFMDPFDLTVLLSAAMWCVFGVLCFAMEPDSTTFSSYQSIGMQLYFLSLQLLGGVLGYAFIYNEGGTSKPSWTGFLG